jgi:RsiW-degrading membrane proteinase PrsW (M82 family)
MAFLVAGLVEETIKFMIAYWFTKRSSYFSEEYDGIIYTVAVGLGFAFMENILYIGSALISEGAPLATALARAFTAVPSHALDGAVMGYFIGRAHFATDPGERLRLNFLGLLLAILFHGLYDFFAFSTFVLPERVAGWSIAGLIWTLGVQWGTVHRLVVIAQARSLARDRIKVDMGV